MLSSLPSYSSNYLAPIDLDVTLSIQTHSSISDDSSNIMNEDMVPRSTTSSPKRSGTHNLRREGYSEEKCRYVLVKYCSGIPRNFNYAEGVQLVYEKLREHCGDENLDLSIGVLYEFIEVDTQFTFDQGAAFRRWQFDHSRRAVDLTNNHAPRMGNIIVGNIIPTERLRRWRNQNPNRQRGMKLSDSDSASPASRSSVASVTPHFGIVHRSAWHIENTLYVSSMNGGTRVQYCPTPQELHERAWNETYGRGGRLIQERRILTPSATIPMDFEEPNCVKPSKKKRVVEILVYACTGSFSYVLKIRLPRGRFTTPSFLRIKCDCIFGRHRSLSVPRYEGLEEVMNLPNQDSQEGKAYYRNIKTTNFPDGVEIPNAMFARKHDLMLFNEANEARMPGRQNHMNSVEDLAFQKCLEANYETAQTGRRWTYRGPLTASLFKDSGIDYQWDVADASGSGVSKRTLSNVQLSSDSYLSPHQERTGDLPALSLAASPARRQRARSLSKRALQGGKDMIQHDYVNWTVDEGDKDATRPYASWRRSGTQAHLFSGNPGASSSREAVGVASGSHFDRFAAQLQSKFQTSGSRPLRARGLERSISRPEVGIRQRTVESVQARKQLLKKIVTFDGAQDDVIAVDKKMVNSIAIYRENNRDKNNNNNNNNINKTQPFLGIKRRARLVRSILRSPLIHKLSLALEYNISALAGKVAEHKMASAPGDATEKIQVDGVFLLKSPMPLTIRKLSEEAKSQQSSHERATLHSMQEEPQEQHYNAQYPPRTSSRNKDGTADSPPSQPRRRKTDSTPSHSLPDSHNRISDDSFMGNFVAVGASESTHPANLGSSRDRDISHRVAMQDAATRYQKPGSNPYEFDDSPEIKQLTHMTTVHEYLTRTFEEDSASTPPRRSLIPNRDSGPWPTSKATGHAKNPSFDANGSYMNRNGDLDNPYIHSSRRAEYQQELPHGYGSLHRTRSSPAIGAYSQPAPSPEIDSYAAYDETYENDDRPSSIDFYGGRSAFSNNRELTSSPVSRGRPSRARGLGINTVEHRDEIERGERDRVQVSSDPVQGSISARKRSKSPVKKLFGPGGLLGNTGLLNSPADPRYVKAKPRHGMVSKIKTKIEEFAEIQRSMSPIRNIFKTEEKPFITSKHPVSLSPPRQAKLYMELELLICATTNRFLMDQYKNSRMSAESMKKIAEFWRSKGRPQVIEFQYDQATQRDLIVANQREFQFHGNNSTNALQVNAMLYSWKQNARQMSVRTFCTPDTVIQKQLHDTYRMLELLGAGMPTFMALQDIHKEFNKHVKRAQEARGKREMIKQLNGVERRVVLPETPIEPILPSPSRGATQQMFFNSPSDVQQGPSDRIDELRARARSRSDASKSAAARDPLYPPKLEDPYYAAPVVKRGPYADQSAMPENYYQPQIAELNDSYATHFSNSSRPQRTSGPRASDPRDQQERYGNSSSVRPYEQRNQYDDHDSSTAYSSRASESRNQPNNHDSSTSYSSQATHPQIRPEDPRSNADLYYLQKAQPSHHSRSNSYSTQVANARMLPEQRGSADSYTSRSTELRNRHGGNRDDTTSRRREAVSPDRRNAKLPPGQGHQRPPSGDSDYFRSFGKYGVGLH